MLRSKQVVDRLRSARDSPSSLAHLYWQLSKSERSQCQVFCDEINHQWRKSSFQSVHTSEQALFMNLCAENHSMIWSIASKVKEERGKRASAGLPDSITGGSIDFGNSLAAAIPDPEVITPNIYLLLMSSIVKARSKTQVPLAIQLFRELITGSPSVADLKLACKLLFSTAEFCHDFSLLLDFRLVFEKYMLRNGSETVGIQYSAAVLHILLNTGQYSSAVRYLEETLSSVQAETVGKVYSALPMGKFWARACHARDFKVLSDSLEAYLMCPDAPAITDSDWMQYLGLGLAYNDHKLVRLVYEALSQRDIAFSSSSLAQIVHLFSTQGDVEQCTKVIEKHYLYLKGERALTKELSLSIISAYCHHLTESAGAEDLSWYSILEVIGSFLGRLHFSYHEISDAVSFKLNHLAIIDDKVQWAKRKEAFRVDKQLEAREAEKEARDVDEALVPEFDSWSLPKKSTNPNVRSGEQGNALRNMDVLSAFTTSTMEYIQQQGFSLHSKQLIVNCLLSHINVYQNFSAVAHFLGVLQKVDPTQARSYLNEDSYEIIFESVSKSPASVACGLFLFQTLNEKQQSLSQHQMECLVISSLRHSQYNQLLEFYCYELVCRGFTPSLYMIQRILRYKQVNDDAKKLVSVLQDCVPDKADIIQKWDENNFQRTLEGLKLPELQVPYSDFDARDCKLLKSILNDERTGNEKKEDTIQANGDEKVGTT